MKYLPSFSSERFSYFISKGGSLFGPVVLALLCCVSMRMSAQESHGPSTVDVGLPDAPGFGQTAVVQGTGSISGVVMDINGGLVPGAKVTLLEHGRTDERVTTAGTDGRFSFADLDVGRFKLTITASGLETFVSSEIGLKVGERRELPRIDLPIAATSTDVTVVVTQEQLAQEQIKEAEKQRAFGIFPNFYTSYVWDAAPLTRKQKYDLGLHSVADPVTFLAVGVASGIEQARNTFPGYGQGAKGYAKRYGAGYADDAIGRMLSSAVFPSIFHQDPRYFYMGSGTVRERAWYALRSAVVAKGDNGKWQPAYSFVLGSFASGAISNAYHSADDRGAGLTIRNGFLDLAGHAADNLLREFISRKVTPNIPVYETGKPE
ncbi:carboxypeptidase-like regulatory domain-containing protein [Granulicella arctica]|uniref:carboxypeptidase-like regulatory domain-containing protein n=1 Tax=Granulicella arctica TaxID=940613 RepID=UPI0021E06A19|nr:carboxypeptidase-like regulatory domain-containing protein [Granulicella arctica]